MTNLRKLFWERYTLDQLNQDEWEALCDGCAKCCLLKLVYHKKTYMTNISCSKLETDSCRCSDYTKNIYVYSFSLNPEEYQPSGICNFTRINDIKLTISMSKKIDKIYAVNYNILRIKNGLGQLVYM